MNKKLIALGLLLGLFVVSTSAQVTVPNTLVAGTVIKATDLNTNFSTIANHALDRLSGGNIAGNVTADVGITIDGIDLSAALCATCAATHKDLTLASPATGLTVGGNVIINTSGKIPALTSTYFSALDASTLTGLNATQLTSGTVPDARFPATLPAASGVNLTGLNATNLGSGTVPDARFPATLPAISGAALTSLPAANLTGTLPAISGFNLTITNAANLSGSINDARLSANVPLLSANNAWAGTATYGARSGPVILSLGGAIGGGATTGPSIVVQNNSSASGAAGTIVAYTRGSAPMYLWVDNSSIVRVHTAAPTADNATVPDLAGVIVGTQSSTLDTKTLLGHDLQPKDALDILLTTPVRQFVYKSGYGGKAFQGIIADWSPEFAMDPDAKHPNGKSFNPVNAFGYTVQAMKELQQQIDELKAEVTRLKAERR